MGILRLSAVRSCTASTDSLPGRYLAAVRARCAGLGSVKDAVIMMLVSYRPLAAGVLLVILERYMRVDRGDEGSGGPTALNSVHLGFS